MSVALPLPREVRGHVLFPEALLFSRVIPWGQELIADAERLDLWQQATQIRPLERQTFTSDYRNNDLVHLTWRTHPDLLCFERGLEAAIHACARVYNVYNPFLTVTHDVGYELLRYRPGQHFKEHIDEIAGDPRPRILSVVVFLNDDYTGGELAFPRQGVKLKARAGDIIVFPSNVCFPHASLDVGAGTKYSVVAWLTADPSMRTAGVGPPQPSDSLP